VGTMATTSNAASECEARPGAIELAVTGHLPSANSCCAALIFISHPGRYMGRRNVVPGGLDVHLLVVKKDICSEYFQKLTF
jgi:hypothetical protein